MRAACLVLLLTSGVLLSAPATATLTFTLSAETSSGAALDRLSVGDFVTTNITLRNDGQRIRVFSASAVGYDSDVLAFRSGISTNSVLSRACIPSANGSDCFGGIYHDLGGIFHPTNIQLEEDLRHPLGPYVKIFSGEAGFPFSSTGESDVGIGGVAGGPQFQLVFEVISPGSSAIDFGVHSEYSDMAVGPLVHASHNAALSLSTLIPEPGTALLLGMGLMGMAFRRSSPSSAPCSCPRRGAERPAGCR